MTSTIHADKIMNSSGDQDSGLDLLVNDQVKIKTANTDRVTVTDATTSISNDLNVDSGTLFVDASENKVGIGTTTVRNNLDFGVTSNNDHIIALRDNNTSRTILGLTNGYGVRVGSPSDGTNSEHMFEVGQISSSDGTTYQNTKLAVTYSGKVGVTVSPPASEDTNFKNVHVGDQASYGEYDGGSLYVVKNRYYNGSNWIAKENGAGSAINMDTSGVIHLQTSANVNAGQTGGLTTRVSVKDSNGLMYIPAAYSVTTGTGANMYIQSDGAFYRSTSSRRYKNTIEDATHGLAELLKLRSVTYKGNNDGDIILGGLIAEEVHDAGLTEFVQYNDDNEPDALSYGNMVSLCVKAIQEQQEKIEALEAKVKALESK